MLFFSFHGLSGHIVDFDLSSLFGYYGQNNVTSTTTPRFEASATKALKRVK